MFKVKSKLYYASVLGLLFSPQSHATLIQILHTNDLHASLETAGAPASGQEYGGWAQLKVVMDQLTADATAKGIETVKLDAGDYTEGTMFYFPNQGIEIMHAFQHMGYDASAMGNHDWLMGADEMDSLYGAEPFPFPILSANVSFQKSLPNLRKQIVPTTQIVRSGIKIGIFGLSTDETLYSWIPRVGSGKNQMKLDDYRDQLTIEPGDNGEAGTRLEPGIANNMIADLRKKNDVVIALTHIGYEEDMLLAAASRGGLDLIVGGHSHTFLPTATIVNDVTGQPVPIVQTGYNGQCVGKIIMDVEPGKRPVLVSYELVPVYKQAAQDPAITGYVQDALNARSVFYPNLNDVLGSSADRLVSGDAGPTSFSQFAVNSFEDAVKSEVDFSIDVGAFHGNTPQPAGTVTRLNLMEMYPRKFEYTQNEGLYIYEAEVPGIAIKLGLQYAVKYGMYVAMSGVTYDLLRMNDAEFAKVRAKAIGTPDYDLMTPYYPSNIRVKGKAIEAFHWYTLSGPESLVRGAMAVSSLMPIIIHHPRRTTHTIWDAMSNYLQKIGTIEKIPALAGPSPWTPGIHTPRSIVNDLINEGVYSVKHNVDNTGI